MCGRNFCPSCQQELIHRDHRHGWESASAFGQIVWRCGPVRLTCGDLDFYAGVFGVDTEGKTLMRLIEHKQPDQDLKGMQKKALVLVARSINELVANHPNEFDGRSGVFVVRGEIEAEPHGRRRTYFKGPQEVSKIMDGRLIPQGVLEDQERVFRWLEGTKAPGGRRNKYLPEPDLLGAV